jgi:agmatine deiminase
MTGCGAGARAGAQEPPQPPVEEGFAEGFSFPDEWAEREGTIMILPPRHAYGDRTDALRREFAALARALREHEPVHVFVYSADLAAARALLGPGVRMHAGDEYGIDWARDTAPMIVRDARGRRKAVCFRFNGWGGKYEGWERDTGVNLAIARALGLPVEKSDLVLEGGAIEIGSTDRGPTGIVTEQCVLNPNRTDWPREKVEAELKRRLGLTRIIWLPKGINPDPVTDGHVDGLVKFIRTNTVLLHTTDDRADVNYDSCREARRRLEAAGLRVIELPLARHVVHMNFYIGSCGRVVYVPICGDPAQDDPALGILRRFFEKVVPIRTTAIAAQGGGIHCTTMQIPRGAR